MRLGKLWDASFGRTGLPWCLSRRDEGYVGGYYDAFTGGEQSSQGLEAVAGKNLADAHIAGFAHKFFYTNVAPWHITGAYCIDQAARVAGSMAWARASRVLMIDMEIAYWQPTGEWLEERVVHEAISEAKARGFRVLLYTANWVTNFWSLHLGHMPRFDCDGVYANYDGVPVIDESQAPACLAPDRRWIGKQYGGRTLDGVEIDENVFDLDWLEAGQVQQQKEIDMFRATLPNGGQYLITNGCKKALTLEEAQVYDLAGIPGVPITEAQAVKFPDWPGVASGGGSSAPIKGTWTQT